MKIPAPQEPEVPKDCDNVRTHIATASEWIRRGIDIDRGAERVYREMRVASYDPERERAVPGLDRALKPIALQLV